MKDEWADGETEDEADWSFLQKMVPGQARIKSDRGWRWQIKETWQRIKIASS